MAHLGAESEDRIHVVGVIVLQHAAHRGDRLLINVAVRGIGAAIDGEGKVSVYGGRGEDTSTIWKNVQIHGSI